MTVPARRYWRRAEIRRDEEGGLHRPVGWLELFFDLVFVVIVAALAGDLAHHLDAAGLGRFALQFMAVFWVWNSFTYYTERFETDGLENRLFTFLAILTVAGLAVWAEDGLHGNLLGFAGSYLAARALNIGLWLRAGWHERMFLPIAARFATGFLVAVALTVGGIVLENPGLFAVAVVIEIAAPVLTIRQQGELPPLSRSKWPERFGLFTMIVLGETVAQVVHALSAEDAAGDLSVPAGVVGLAVGFGLWWLYYDFVARRPSRQQIATALGWVYLHLVMLLCVTVVGVAIAESLIEDGHVAFVLLSVGASVIVLGVLETTLDRDDDEPTHVVISPLLKVALGVVLMILAVLHWDALPALVICLVALAVPAVYGAQAWFGKRSPGGGTAQNSAADGAEAHTGGRAD